LTVANFIASAVQPRVVPRSRAVQKIESSGALTSGHRPRFHNVLAAILACASYGQAATDPASPTYRYLEATEASAHRGAAVDEQLPPFPRREVPHLAVVNANDCISRLKDART